MAKPTLIWRSVDQPRDTIQSNTNPSSASSNKMIDKLLPRGKTKRLVISDHKYFYDPSDEYKQYVLKFKKNFDQMKSK